MTDTRAPLSRIQPADRPDACSSDEDASMRPRDRKRNKLRRKIIRGLSESTGKAEVSMPWGEHAFVERVVIGEGKLLEGWPKHIPFGALARIPGGLPVVEELLTAWEDGTLHWRDATAAELASARRDHRSVLPSTPVLPRRQSQPHTDARWIVGTLVTHVSAPGTIVRCPTAAPEGKEKRRRVDGGGGRAAKRRHVDESVLETPRLGQRADNNTVRARRFRNPKTGVKTAQYLWEDDGAPGGCVPLDRDLGRVLEDGRAVMLEP